MTPTPSLSVLLPVRDAEETLPDAIASIRAQSDEEFEVVAVDDGSTDGSARLLEEWAATDARVRLMRTGGVGVVRALEEARRTARGALLARMDADDVALPRRFAEQRAYLATHSDVVLCGCRVRYVPREAVRGGARRYEAWLNATTTPEEVEREVFVECPLAHPTWMMRADAVDAVGGYRDAGWPEDYDLLLRLWRAGGRLGVVPRVLLHWREGAGRLSRTHPRYSREAFVRCRAHHLTRSLLHGRAGAVIWGAGPVGKAMARALAAEGAVVLAFAEVDPRKIGQEIHGAPVVDGEGALAVRDALHLAAVGQEGGRSAVREILVAAGLRELRDFVAVA